LEYTGYDLDEVTKADNEFEFGFDIDDCEVDLLNGDLDTGIDRE